MEAVTKGIKKRIRFRILMRDGFKCAYCGKGSPDGALLHVDHKVARSKGGSNEDDNLITACADCNLGKSDIDLPIMAPDAPKDPFVGKWFVSFNAAGEVETAGKILGRSLQPDMFLAHFIDWFHGELGASQHLIALPQSTPWLLFNTEREAVQWINAHEPDDD